LDLLKHTQAFPFGQMRTKYPGDYDQINGFDASDPVCDLKQEVQFECRNDSEQQQQF
jgi:hypothetical protein